MTAGLAGRRAELEAIEAALDALGGGSSGCLQVAGEPGIGKTRLLHEIGARAQERGHLVVVGRAAEFERDLPFGVFVDALDDYLSSLDDGPLDRPASFAPELAVVFPALAGRADQGPPMLQAERHRTHRAVRALLEGLGASQPLVVMLDDLHWADPASIELVSHLLAHPPRGPVMVVLAFRPAQTAPGLITALTARARQDPKARLLEMSPLTRSESDIVLGGGVDGHWAEELYRQSGGNPFYLEQLRRTDGLGGTGRSATPVDPAGTDVPALVRASLAGELGSLAPRARSLLEGAAVAGDPFEDLLAAEASAIAEGEALQLLDELVRLDLVRVTEVPRRYRFRHPIVRRVVYESAGAGWRLGAHARLAAALTAQGFSPAALAHHVERSARRGDEAAVAVLSEAGRSTASRAPATAAHWYDAALRLLPEGPDYEPRRLELLVAKATALGSAGQLEASHASLVEALDRLPPGSPGRVKVATFCASVELGLGNVRQTRARLLAALGELEDLESPEAVGLRLELAIWAAYSNDFVGARRWGQETVEGAVLVGDPALEAVAAAVMAWSACAASDIAEAECRLERAAALFDILDDGALARRLDLGLWLGWAEVWMERYDEAIRHCERAIEVSRATGQGHFVALTMTARAWALLMKGRLGEAGEAASAAAESSRLGAHGILWEAVGFQAMAASYAGDLGTSLRLAEESLELARSLHSGVFTAVAGLILAVVLVEAGEYERARDEVLAVGGGRDLPLFAHRGLRVLACETLGRADLGLGRVEAAAEWASGAESIVSGNALPVEAGVVGRTRALVLLAQGRPGEAAEAALAAAAGTAGVAPLETGRSLLVAGGALALTGEREQAVVQLELAEQQLASCGAARYLDQARSELCRLDRSRRRRPGGTAVTGLPALTEREREIAEAITTGMTNRQIAQRCFLSEKTVERHLTHIFDKLGVSSRAAVAGAVARAGVNPAP